MTLRRFSVQTKSESGQQKTRAAGENAGHRKSLIFAALKQWIYAWPPLVSRRTVAMVTALGKEVKRWELDLLRLGVGERNISGPVLLLFIKRKWESRRKD